MVTYRLTRLLAAALLSPGLALAMTADYNDLNFTTSGQSMWGTGDAFILDETKFLGYQWTNATNSLDLLAGSENSLVPGTGGTIPNPAYAGWVLCGGPLGNPLCGSEPSTTIPNPIPAQYADTRFGVEVSATTSGKLGFNLNLEINSGSVDSELVFDASFLAPKDYEIKPLEYVQLNNGAGLDPNSSLMTDFPDMSASLEAVLQISGSIDGVGCPIIGTCYDFGRNINLNETPDIISFNADGNYGIEVLEGLVPAPLGGGFPISFDVGYGPWDFGEITMHFPDPDTDSTAGGPGNGVVGDKIVSTGQDDLLDLIIDLDAMASIGVTSGATTEAFGSSIDVPVLGTLGWDIIDVKAGPTMDLQQDFELMPSLQVLLDFSRDVLIADQWVSSWSGAWADIPAMAFNVGTTVITPTFSVLADLTNQLSLDFDLEFMLSILRVYWDFGLLGADSFGVLNDASAALNLVTTPPFFDKMFALEGFATVVGDPFSITVSEPGTLLLFVIGLLCVGFLARGRA